MTRRRGSQAVEFALSLPILLLFVGGTADVAQYLFDREGLVAAVAAGARAGATVNAHEPQDPLRVAEQTAATSWHVSGRGTARFAAVSAGASPDRALLLTGEVDLEPWFGLVPALPTRIVYTSRVRMVRQD